MYKIQEKGRPETAVWLLNSATVISNDANADIPFYGSSTGTTRVHILSQGKELYLQDISENTPITVNKQRVNHKVLLHDGDEITLANTSYQIINGKRQQPMFKAAGVPQSVQKDPKLWQLQAICGDIQGQVFKLKPQTLIGRDPACDICIPNSQLSRQHVQLIVTGGKVMMQDMNSTNGSYVNNKRCDHRILDEDDDIRLGKISFQLIAPASNLPTPADEQKTIVMPKVTITPQQGNLGGSVASTNAAEKNWVTKPTSVGNREDDSIDVLLAKHLHVKKITLRFSIVAGIALVALGYFILR